MNNYPKDMNKTDLLKTILKIPLNSEGKKRNVLHINNTIIYISTNDNKKINDTKTNDTLKKELAQLKQLLNIQ